MQAVICFYTQLSLFIGDCVPPSPTTTTGISLGSAVFAGLACQSNPQTSLHQDVCRNSLYLALLACGAGNAVQIILLFITYN